MGGGGVLSEQCIEWVLRNGPRGAKSRPHKAVMVVLAHAADDEGLASPTVKEMVRGSNYSKTYVCQSLKELMREGWIEIAERGGEGKPTTFRLVMDKRARPIGTTPRLSVVDDADKFQLRATEIAKRVFVKRNPQPVTPFPKVVNITKMLLKAGHLPDAVERSLLAAPTITAHACEFLLNGGSQNRGLSSHNKENIIMFDGVASERRIQ